jgi:hypothetical protein
MMTDAKEVYMVLMLPRDALESKAAAPHPTKYGSDCAFTAIPPIRLHATESSMPRIALAWFLIVVPVDG